MAKKIRLGVLASGRGSNLQAIIDEVESGGLKGKAEVVVVLSDHADAYALERARKHGAAAEFVDPKGQRRREDYDLELLKILKKHKIDLLLLAGYMRIVGLALVEAFHNRIMNIHPALLPSFPGLHVQKKALDYGARFSGCTVHFVDGGVDTGPIIIQAVVPVLPDDDEDSLAGRILALEHKVYPEAVRLYAEGKLSLAGRSVVVKGHSADGDAFMINPPVKS